MSRLVYGLRPVEELLRSRREVAAVYLLAGAGSAALEALAKSARAARILVEERDRGELDALAEGQLHQGVVAVAGDFRYVDVATLVERASARLEAPLLLVLDQVQDPQNLGALLRSAHVLGVHGVVIPKDRAAQVTPAVVKASAGATEHVAIAQCVNVARTLEELKAAGVWTVGAVAEAPGGGAAVEPWKIDFVAASAIVLGAEGKGLRPLVARGCDLHVRIPMAGRVSSLNVSAAGAVLLYEAVRQRAAR